jgi:hypothetical protein
MDILEVLKLKNDEEITRNLFDRLVKMLEAHDARSDFLRSELVERLASLEVV